MGIATYCLLAKLFFHMAPTIISRRAASRFGSLKPTPIRISHLIESGVNLRCILEFLGHRSIKTTSIYTHIVNDALTTVKSPFDKMMEQTKAAHARNGSATYNLKHLIFILHLLCFLI
ncbi:MAG: tyrosine-type recombinase/integrase [Bacteroidales bacterium]|nr:tyrosine-type recombinase/integrase [Bacteroidales bacterium]